MSLQQRGERNANARLTLTKVEDIRRLILDGHADGSIAKGYGVSPGTIRLIRLNKAWHDPAYSPPSRSIPCPSCKGTGRVLDPAP